jgi:hypothetical protein
MKKLLICILLFIILIIWVNTYNSKNIKELKTDITELQKDKKELQKQIYRNSNDLFVLQNTVYKKDIQIWLDILKNTLENLNDCEFNWLPNYDYNWYIKFYCFWVEQSYMVNTKTKDILIIK